MPIQSEQSYPAEQPFPDVRVASGDRDAKARGSSVGALHTAEFPAIAAARRLQERYLDSYASEPPGAGKAIGVSGRYGAGKTHLILDLLELAGKRTPSPLIVYVKVEWDNLVELYKQVMAQIPLATFYAAYIHLLSQSAETFVDGKDILQWAKPALSQDASSVFYFLNKRLLPSSEVRSGVSGAATDITHSEDFARAFSDLAEPDMRQDAYDWLRGNALKPDTLARLGLQSSIDTVESVLAGFALILYTFNRAGQPFLLYIDQIERLLLTVTPEREPLPDAQHNIAALQSLAELFCRERAFLCLAGENKPWTILPPDFFARVQRVEIEPLSFKGTMDLLAVYILAKKGQSFCGAASAADIYPFNEDAALELTVAARGNTRRVLEIAYRAFDAAFPHKGPIGREQIQNAALYRTQTISVTAIADAIVSVLTEQNVVFTRDADVGGNVRVHFALLSAGQPYAAITLSLRAFSDDEVEQAIGYLQQVRAVRESGRQIAQILVVAGYISPGVQDRLSPFADYYVAYDPHEVTAFRSELSAAVREIGIRQQEVKNSLDDRERAEPRITDEAIEQAVVLLRGDLASTHEQNRKLEERFRELTRTQYAQQQKDLTQQIALLRQQLEQREDDRLREARQSKDRLLTEELEYLRRSGEEKLYGAGHFSANVIGVVLATLPILVTAFLLAFQVEVTDTFNGVLYFSLLPGFGLLVVCYYLTMLDPQTRFTRPGSRLWSIMPQVSLAYFGLGLLGAVTVVIRNYALYYVSYARFYGAPLVLFIAEMAGCLLSLHFLLRRWVYLQRSIYSSVRRVTTDINALEREAHRIIRRGGPDVSPPVRGYALRDPNPQVRYVAACVERELLRSSLVDWYGSIDGLEDAVEAEDWSPVEAVLVDVLVEAALLRERPVEAVLSAFVAALARADDAEAVYLLDGLARLAGSEDRAWDRQVVSSQWIRRRADFVLAEGIMSGALRWEFLTFAAPLSAAIVFCIYYADAGAMLGGGQFAMEQLAKLCRRHVGGERLTTDFRAQLEEFGLERSLNAASVLELMKFFDMGGKESLGYYDGLAMGETYEAIYRFLREVWLALEEIQYRNRSGAAAVAVVG